VDALLITKEEEQQWEAKVRIVTWLYVAMLYGILRRQLQQRALLGVFVVSGRKCKGSSGETPVLTLLPSHAYVSAYL
jgi:hypothetical protein